MAVRLCGLAVLAVGVGAFAPAARRPPRALPVASASVSDAATISEIEGKENLLRTLDENADKLVVIKYFASWCRSCRSMKPRFERVASDWGSRARFFEVEYDKNKELCRDDLNLLALPTVQIYAGGAAGLLDTFSCGPSKVITLVDKLENYSVAMAADGTLDMAHPVFSDGAASADAPAEDAASAKDRPRAARSPEPSPAPRAAAEPQSEEEAYKSEEVRARLARARSEALSLPLIARFRLVRAAGLAFDAVTTYQLRWKPAANAEERRRRARLVEGMMTPSRKTEAAQMFALIDSDNDGEVSMADLRNLMTLLGRSNLDETDYEYDEEAEETRLRSIIQSADADQNERIDLDEFVSLVARAEFATLILEAFRVFDADGSGLLDAGELERGLRGLGEALGDDGTSVEKIFEEYDLERTGQINYEGFVRLMVSGGN